MSTTAPTPTTWCGGTCSRPLTSTPVWRSATGELASLAERIGLKPDEVEQWLTRAEQIRLPAETATG